MYQALDLDILDVNSADKPSSDRRSGSTCWVSSNSFFFDILSHVRLVLLPLSLCNCSI